MSPLLTTFILLLGALLGAAVTRLHARGDITQWRAKACQLEEHLNKTETERNKERLNTEEKANALAAVEKNLAHATATITHERMRTEEKIALLDEAQTQLSDAFKALAAQALEQNNQNFLDLARTSLERFQEQAKDDLSQRHDAVSRLVLPVQEGLKKVDAQVRELEQARKQAYGELNGQIKALGATHRDLQAETSKLVSALHTPTARGRWGEVQLRRVVEMAGMLAHCDFVEQATIETEGGRQRPDLIVKLPGNTHVVVDAKTPFDAYYEAINTTDTKQKQQHLHTHAKSVQDHINRLSAKEYWAHFEPSPDFVVMFLPGESFFSAALEHDPSLIEKGIAKKVILATPTTLIALLRTISYGWRQEAIAENAAHVAQLGRELYDRLTKIGEHMRGMGKNLERTVDSYNRALGSLENRVLVTARKFVEIGVAEEHNLETLSPVETAVRKPVSPELTGNTNAIVEFPL